MEASISASSDTPGTVMESKSKAAGEDAVPAGLHEPPAVALQAALKPSEEVPQGSAEVRGYGFPRGKEVDYDLLLRSWRTTGFQASCLAQAVDLVNRMLDWRLSHEPVEEDALELERDPAFRESTHCKVFLGFTSNLMSSGLREIFCFLARHRLVDVIVTTAGGVEEDIVKCLGPTYLGDFGLPGKQLRDQGLNRIGNLLVPNDNYCKFEDWVLPLLDDLLVEQREQGVVWAPSTLIARMGERINNETSVLYWAHKNGIPVYCPGLTDGSLGDMMYFHSYRNPGLVVDIVSDVRRMNNEAVHAGPRKTGIVVLGGGLPKHHINNANMMRNGADFAVYINTAAEFDGSDSGARPDEAVSWGKIRADAEAVKVHCDATIAFPLLVAQTFAQRVPPPDVIPAPAASAAPSCPPAVRASNVDEAKEAEETAGV